MSILPQQKNVSQSGRDSTDQLLSSSSSSISTSSITSTTTTGGSATSTADDDTTSSSTGSIPTEKGGTSAVLVAGPPPAPASSTPSNANSAGVQRRMQLNPDLRFERLDNEYIPPPPLQNTSQMSLMLHRIYLDRTRYPEGRYRMVDYFRAAVELFLNQVKLEYTQQLAVSQRHHKPMTRFSWKNKGELAVCFACCCDTLKLLYDTIQPGPTKPLWDALVQQLAPLLIVESRVPATILTAQTYHTKYMDWLKGGTRYAGEQSVANVRFPSAQERRIKIETFLRTGAGYKLEAVTVDPATIVRQPPLSSPAARSAGPSVPTIFVPPGVRMEVKTSVAPPHQRVAPQPFIAPLVPSSKSEGPGPVRAPARAPPRNSGPHPPAPVAVKQMPEEMRHLYWLSALAHVKGGEPGAAFPDERAAAMPGFVRLCEITERISEMRVLVDVVAASSEGIQTVFERLGGLVALRRFTGVVMKAGDTPLFIHFIHQVVRLKGPVLWSTASQRAWRTDATNTLTDDLTWLRGASLIPATQRAAWGALVMIMEEKYIFRAAFEEVEEARKRRRMEPSLSASASTSLNTSALRTAMSDNCGFQNWKLPRVNTLAAARLPVTLRAPRFSSELEQDTIEFLNEKKAYADSTQAEWYSRIVAALRANHVDENSVVVPLWYDPFQLLGINPLV